MAQIDGAGQQDTDNQNAEALQAPLPHRQVPLQGQPQGGSDVPIHQNSDPVSDESEILRSCQPLTGKRRVPCCTPSATVQPVARGALCIHRMPTSYPSLGSPEVAIPDYETLMLQVLRAASSDEITIRDCIDRRAPECNLTEAERQEL